MLSLPDGLQLGPMNTPGSSTLGVFILFPFFFIVLYKCSNYIHSFKEYNKQDKNGETYQHCHTFPLQDLAMLFD